MSLRSDCLRATTGLFPDAITPREHVAASSIPAEWARKLAKWLTADQEPFDYSPPKGDMEKLFQKLAISPSELEVADWLAGLGVDDAELQADYYVGITRARKHLVDAWPKVTIDGPAGPQIMPLSPDDIEEVWSLFLVLDDPDHVLKELDSWTLTPTQSLAFRTCYPDLYDHADQAITAALIDKRAKNDDFDMGAEREAQLNILRGKPPEEAPPPAPPAPEPPAKFRLDPERDKTQGQVSSEPKQPGR